MFPECWPECVAGVMLISEKKCPEDPVFVILWGVLGEMLHEFGQNMLPESCYYLEGSSQRIHLA
jgi:hypothetical protein